MKAFLGMGLLGSNFVKAFRQKGQQVNVWNRTASKAKALEAYGAKAFDDIKDAVKDADVIHLTLKDDDTVNEVLAMAQPALKPGAIDYRSYYHFSKRSSGTNPKMESAWLYLFACSCVYGT